MLYMDDDDGWIGLLRGIVILSTIFCSNACRVMVRPFNVLNGPVRCTDYA